MGTSTRCKFTLNQITNHQNGTSTLEFLPVTSGSEENAAFFKWTPTGHIQFTTVNREIADKMKLGGQYYVDITPAE